MIFSPLTTGACVPCTAIESTTSCIQILNNYGWSYGGGMVVISINTGCNPQSDMYCTAHRMRVK